MRKCAQCGGPYKMNWVRSPICKWCRTGRPRPQEVSVAKKEWTVRVISFVPQHPRRELFKGDNEYLSSLWVEQLRHMGHARELAAFDDPERIVIEFYAPRGIDSYEWSQTNAERMHSMGLNAVAAPKWERGSDLKPMYEQAGVKDG